MIDIKLIREKKEETEAALRRRDKGISLDTLIEADKRWREILKKTEDLRKERRELSKGPEARDAGKRVKEQIEKLEQELKQQEVKIEEALLVIPNIPDKVSPDEQRILKQEEAEKKFDFGLGRTGIWGNSSAYLILIRQARFQARGSRS